ncbi:hypothetical protein [Streptomyces anulatus]
MITTTEGPLWLSAIGDARSRRVDREIGWSRPQARVVAVAVS